MSDLPKKTLAELAARYTMEPELRDVYVEGTSDRDILSRVTKKLGGSDTVIYTIDSVEIDAGVLLEAGDTEGQRQRVLALARLLAIETPGCRSYGVADRDLDSWFGPLEECPTLRWTKYNSIENYFLNKEVVLDIVVSIGRAKPPDQTEFYHSFVDVLRRLYSLRLAARELALPLRWHHFDKCLDRNSSRVEIDLADYARRVLAASGMTGEGKTLTAKAANWAAKLTTDVRLECRGHDFLELASWSIRRFGGRKEIAVDGVLSALLVAMAPVHHELDELVS